MITKIAQMIKKQNKHSHNVMVVIGADYIVRRAATPILQWACRDVFVMMYIGACG